MGARKAEWDKKREELFPKWKQALKDADGCVLRASLAFFEIERPENADEWRKIRDRARSTGNSWTRRLGLVKWAGDLRERATGFRFGPQSAKKEYDNR